MLDQVAPAMLDQEVLSIVAQEVAHMLGLEGLDIRVLVVQHIEDQVEELMQVLAVLAMLVVEAHVMRVQVEATAQKYAANLYINSFVFILS